MSGIILDVGKAHQRTIREEKEAEYKSSFFFKSLHDDINADISNAVVKPISYSEAKYIILEYEWLKCMPAMVLYCYGIFYDDVCAGVAVYSTEYIENLGIWDKYDYTGKIILLSRGACVHWAHKHSGSKLISESIKLLPEKYKVVTCTVDFDAGEIGTIYQACNFNYIGSMRENNPKINYKEKDRFGVLINGKIYGARSMRQKIGTCKKEEVLKHYPNAQFIKQHSKHRYFYFRGSKKEKKYYKAQIEEFIKPYPKRK